ncbi:hypothetical protein AHAS_Ahas03G0222400 [Arachis hypogaea]
MVFLLGCEVGIVVIEVPWSVNLVLGPSPVGMSLEVFMDAFTPSRFITSFSEIAFCGFSNECWLLTPLSLKFAVPWVVVVALSRLSEK